MNANCTNNLSDALNSPQWMLISMRLHRNQLIATDDIYHLLRPDPVHQHSHLTHMSPTEFKQQ